MLREPPGALTFLKDLEGSTLKNWGWKPWAKVVAVVVIVGIIATMGYRYFNARTESESWLLSQRGVRAIVDSGRWNVDEVRVRDIDAARGLDAALQERDAEADGAVAFWEDGDGVRGVILNAGYPLDAELWDLAALPLTPGESSRIVGNHRSYLTIDDLASADVPQIPGETQVTVRGQGQFRSLDGNAAAMLGVLRVVVEAGHNPALPHGEDVWPGLLVPDDEILDVALLVGDVQGFRVATSLIRNQQEVETGPWVAVDAALLEQWWDRATLRSSEHALSLTVSDGDCSQLFGFEHERQSRLTCGRASAVGTGAVGELLRTAEGAVVDGTSRLRVSEDSISVTAKGTEVAVEVFAAVRGIAWDGEVSIDVALPGGERAEFRSTAQGPAQSPDGPEGLVEAWNLSGGTDA